MTAMPAPTLPDTSHTRDLVAALNAHDVALEFAGTRGARTVWTAGPLTIHLDRNGRCAGWAVPGSRSTVGGRWGARSGREALDLLLRHIGNNTHPAHFDAPLFRPHTTSRRP